MTITKAEALKRIAAVHEAWSLKHGDDTAYVDNAEMEAPAEAQDELNTAIMAILDQVGEPPYLAGLPSLRHLPGQHDQSSHGHGNAGPGGGVDLIAAGHGEALAAAAFDAAASLPRPEGSGELAGRLLYHGGGVGPHGDEALYHIAAAQGFEGQAKGVSRSEMTVGIVMEGDTEMFRGVRARGGKTAEEMHEQIRSGEAYHGLGYAGNGIYMSSSRSEAGRYGTVGRYALHHDAKVVDFRDLQTEQAEYLQSIGYRDVGKFSVKRDSITGRVFDDPGRYAAARGYDAIRWRRGEEVGKPAGEEDEFIVLNRTALIAEVT